MNPDESLENPPRQADLELDRILPSIDPLEMPIPVFDPLSDANLLAGARTAIERGQEYLFSVQREDSHWCAELESNPTITAEYVYLHQILGRDLGPRRPQISQYLLKKQNNDGSWGTTQLPTGDVSTTAEVYLALRILGQNIADPSMEKATRFILRNGGLEKVRIFTRIFFAMFGLMPWCTIPALPPEIILLPSQSPINIYSLSSWARGTMVPLFVISHHQPIFALPNGQSSKNDFLDHLWLDPADKAIPYIAPWIQLLRAYGLGWKSFFCATDVFLKLYERARVGSVRRKALDICMKWILERQEQSGDWAGIFPPMLNNLIALTLEGHTLDSDPIHRGLQALDRFSWEDSDGYRIQACVSPIWDTALSTISLLDAQVGRETPKIKLAVQWLLDRQLDVSYGDWKNSRPLLQSGGWSFEYTNSWYPDVDDTAAVLLAILKQDSKSANERPVQKAVEWMLGMQNKDGGWAAFDVDNDKLFLNQIPFADIDALCDPSSPDVTGRVLEAFGLLRETSRSSALLQRIEIAHQRALRYLRKSQEAQGSWFGRWGVNYIYGTSAVLCGLARMSVPAHDLMIAPALKWLKQCQNSDGGWGESITSYADKKWMGKGESTPSQTAWALMALLSYLPASDPTIRRGIRWLIGRQIPARAVEAYEAGVRLPEARGATWEEGPFTGTGFPNHFYLRYHAYRHCFPMMALGRFLQAYQN